jgi:integrase
MKYSVFVEQYLKDNSYRLSGKTVLTYHTTNKFFHAYSKNPHISEITAQLINDYINTRSKAQARKDLISLKAMFSYGRKLGLLRKNPCDNLQVPKLKRNFPLIFTKDEFAKFASCIDCPDTKDLIVTAAYTGLRLGELRNLSPANIYGNKIIITSLKSGRVRSVPMNETVKSIVDRNLGKKWIFTYHSDQWKERRVQVRFKKYLKLSGLNQSLHFHCLRHSFATWLIQSGVNILYVKELLGHSTLQTTLIYTHFFNQDLENAISSL